MRAVVTDGRGGLSPADLPAPEAPQDGALVRVVACGLCGSDLEKVCGPDAQAGLVLGHEVVGWLERPDAEPVRVALAHHVPCGCCGACRTGHSSLCAQFTSTRLDPGGFAESLAVSAVHLEDAVFPLPESVDDLAGTLLEPLSCVLRAFDVVKSLQRAFPIPAVGGRPPAPPWTWPGKVLVAGCGSVGLMLLAVLASDTRRRPDQYLGPACQGYYFLEPDPVRAGLAAGLGAVRLEEAGSVDVAIVTAPAALPQVVASMAPGGIVVIFASRGATTDIDVDQVYRRELTLAGVRSGSPTHLRRALELLSDGLLPLEWFRPVVVGLEELPAAFAEYAAGRSLKVVARP